MSELAEALKAVKEWMAAVGDSPEALEAWSRDALLVPQTPFGRDLERLARAIQNRNAANA
jgi:hypothetical protein